MPRYHFNLVDNGGLYSEDDDGIVFDTIEEAYLDAHRSILEMSFEMLRKRTDPFHHRFEVTDETGLVLLDIAFLEVLRPRAPSRKTLTAEVLSSVRQEMQRSQTLKADLLQQIESARATIKSDTETPRAHGHRGLNGQPRLTSSPRRRS